EAESKARSRSRSHSAEAVGSSTWLGRDVECATNKAEQIPNDRRESGVVDEQRQYTDMSAKPRDQREPKCENHRRHAQWSQERKLRRKDVAKIKSERHQPDRNEIPPRPPKRSSKVKRTNWSVSDRIHAQRSKRPNDPN